MCSSHQLSGTRSPLPGEPIPLRRSRERAAPMRVVVVLKGHATGAGVSPS